MLLLPLALLQLLPLALANDPLLLFASSSVFQFTVGTSMPIAMAKKGSLSATLGYQFNYALPSNLSQLEPVQIVHARSTRQTDQQFDLSTVYTSMEELLERYGWGDARHCMLRTICELAEVPLHRRGDDVVEEIIHLLLTSIDDEQLKRLFTDTLPTELWRRPSEDGELENGSSSPYAEAEILGRSGKGQCGVVYSGCLGSPLDSFTELGLAG